MRSRTPRTVVALLLVLGGGKVAAGAALVDTHGEFPAVTREVAAGALPLAAALIACHHEPATLPLRAADERLATAARREGFSVDE
jgi:hypothetical protein